LLSARLELCNASIEALNDRDARPREEADDAMREKTAHRASRGELGPDVAT